MPQPISRRSFIRSAAAVSAGFMGLRHATDAWGAGPGAGGAATQPATQGYGPLIPDPQQVLDLPEGFSYRVISRMGMEMDDGLMVPGKHDGAAAFPGPDGLVIHICNHECDPTLQRLGPYGWSLERLNGPALDRIYDRGYGQTPALGGCTTTVYDPRSGNVVRRYMSLIGSERNCAGGPTPWNSWLTCEETTTVVGERHEKDHGYVFEVPARAEIAPADPLPLKAMGRMNHEACAVDPTTGIIYQTEDRQDGSFYRFIPHTPATHGDPATLADGGRLQALVLVDRPGHDTRNWLEEVSEEEATKFDAAGAAFTKMDRSEHSNAQTPLNLAMPVRWIDVDNVEAPDDDLRQQTQANGAARFARGEGCWYGRQSVYFVCTTGGRNRSGQLFRYVPSRFEGTPEEDRFPGRLELFLEPNNHELLENGDNLTFAPWGDMVVCEDKGDNNRIVGITPRGDFYLLGHNALSKSEFAGACFSPDGQTLFVNIQAEGLTLAVTGPWRGRI